MGISVGKKTSQRTKKKKPEAWIYRSFHELKNTHAQNAFKPVHYKYTPDCEAQTLADFNLGVSSGATEA